ncbi:TonB-dependent receptor domain-containing protein [Shewanella sp. KT0246]|uniref:TonB-dependent receptor domain-containing protein n=1 Tax=Shewanella sp. KT0246 TaxID=2815912 RepID=UPI001BBE54FE|nr:TonB-dependent receptor [Shewanella sp. KT0246]GIU48473.1 vitamin B12 transporter BtuB [Shewanella sp. KT0246]
MSFKLRLSVITLALLQAYSVQAAAPAVPMNETIVVTGTRFDSSAEKQLTVINTIEREEIDSLSPKSVVDVLEQLPGLSVTRNGGAGQNATVSIRGTSSGHTLVLVDGLRIGSATLGSINFGAISPQNIERIEVVKGPRASVWGSDAIGGVIQIFTRKLDGGEWYASAEAGSNNYVRGSLGGGIKHGDGSSTISVSSESSDGYDVYNGTPEEADDDGYDRIGINVIGSQNVSEQWQVNWNMQYDTGNNQYDDTYGMGSSDESDFDNYLWNLGTQYTGERYTSKFNLGQSQDSNTNFRGDNPDVPKSDYETTRDQISWTNQYLATESLTLIGGADWYNESVTGDYENDERNVIGVYALAQYNWSNFLFEGAIRYDDVENIDNETSYNLSAAYQFSESWRLTASTGTGFRAPTFNDLYWPGSGNPDLVSETSTNNELTLNYNSKAVQAYISVFQNEIDNLIAWAPNETGMWMPANINEAKIKGAELSLNARIAQLDHKMSYTYLDTSDETTGEELVGRSEHEFDYSIGYQWQNFDVMVNYHHQSERYSGYGAYLDAYDTLDVSLGYLFAEKWQVRLKANNVFDEEFSSVNNYNNSGAEYFLSLSYQAF